MRGSCMWSLPLGCVLALAGDVVVSLVGWLERSHSLQPEWLVPDVVFLRPFTILLVETLLLVRNLEICYVDIPLRKGIASVTCLGTTVLYSWHPSTAGAQRSWTDTICTWIVSQLLPDLQHSIWVGIRIARVSMWPFALFGTGSNLVNNFVTTCPSSLALPGGTLSLWSRANLAETLACPN